MAAGAAREGLCAGREMRQEWRGASGPDGGMVMIFLHRVAAILAGLLLGLAMVPAAAADGPTAEQQAYMARMEALVKSLHPQHGDIALAQAKATLHLGDDYYFLNAEDSRKVIVEAWGNPPEAANGVLGTVFPAGKSFLDPESWGAVITYEQQGHVSDDDAATADFDALLAQMKEGEEARNAERTQQGYPAMILVGWAERPAYDRTHHSVVWARDLMVGGDPGHALNYDVRLLGRAGVLSLNMISDMAHLQEVKAAAAKFSRAATFDTGFAYTDYVEGVDQAAGYGIGGLVAAGVGVAAVKKLGLLAVLLAFGKKIGIFVVIGLAALWKGIKRLFGGRGSEDALAAGAHDAPEAPADHAMEAAPEADDAPPKEGPP